MFKHHNKGGRKRERICDNWDKNENVLNPRSICYQFFYARNQGEEEIVRPNLFLGWLISLTWPRGMYVCLKAYMCSGEKMAKRVTLLVATTCSDLETDPAYVSYHKLVRSFLSMHWQKYYIKLACTAGNLFIEAAVILQL